MPSGQLDYVDSGTEVVIRLRKHEKKQRIWKICQIKFDWSSLDSINAVGDQQSEKNLQKFKS